MPRTSQPIKTSKRLPSRPTDILRAPKLPRPPGLELNGAAKYWKVAADEAAEWPYPDPDIAFKPEPDLDVAVPPDQELPTDIVPYSEDEPWGRRSDEGETMYKYFLAYRAQGFGRELQAVAHRFNVKRNTIGDYAKNYDWHERAVAWDIMRERVYTAEMLNGVRDMAQKHVRVAAKAIKSTAAVFEEIDRRLEKDDKFLKSLGRLPAKTLMTLAQRSAQVIPNLMAAERLARNLPTEITAIHVDHDLRIQTTDDLAKILVGVLGSLPGSDVIDGTVIEVEPGEDGEVEEGADSEAQ